MAKTCLADNKYKKLFQSYSECLLLNKLLLNDNQRYNHSIAHEPNGPTKTKSENLESTEMGEETNEDLNNFLRKAE